MADDDDISDLLSKIEQYDAQEAQSASTQAQDKTQDVMSCQIDQAAPVSVPEVQNSLALVETQTAIEPKSEVLEDPLVKGFFDRYSAVATEILDSCRSDRQEAQDIIDLLLPKLQAAATGGPEAPRSYVDNVVAAMEVKTRVNDTAVKALDAGAKLLVATRKQAQINNNTNITNVSSAELTEILRKPLTESY